MAPSALRLPCSVQRRRRAVQLCCRHGFGRGDGAVVRARRKRALQRLFQCGHRPEIKTERALARSGLPRSLLALAPQLLALPRRQGGHSFALMPTPCDRAYHRATDLTARPNEFKRQKAPPRIIPFHDGARDEVARHRGGIEPAPAECAGEPDAGLEFPNLRHAVDRKSHPGRPEILELHRGELRIRRAERAFEPSLYPLRTRPYRGNAGPQQAVTADDAVMMIGVMRIADRPVERDRLAKPPAKRPRHTSE